MNDIKLVNFDFFQIALILGSVHLLQNHIVMLISVINVYLHIYFFLMHGTGNINEKNQTDKALRGANCVFHLAFYGIAGKEMLQTRQIDEINLIGTCNLLDSCVKCGVERLVFTSSYNVVFGGQRIVNGDENIGYFPIEKNFDSLGRCKALAEQLVLKSNGRPLKSKGGRKLHTCAIRPAAIYGPDEEYHVPRLLNLAQKGIFLYVLGGPEVKTDWVYIDNLVQAQLLASMGLIDDIPGRQGAPASGQVYFISDGAPVNTFKFMQPLIEGLGYQLPKHQLSVKSAMRLAWIFWGLYGLMYPWLNKGWLPQPPFLPAEVQKVGVTHNFSILKARQELGYVPYMEPKEGIRRTLEHWKMKQGKELRSPELIYWIAIPAGMTLLFCSAFIPPQYLGILQWARWLALFLFRTQYAVQTVFVVACIIHLGEAVYAWNLARRVDSVNCKGWFWQTLALGFSSLRLLIRRSHNLGY
ncbi:hypothetical protein KP509_02G112700 [Ceratopteris richardii]|uniref:3-beta hydroxysteroid dehydrogenase/isomerase domain-containing protein n=1 Tax=Ceratopteris richardii TaxID=49495 RepID=A0A8T2VL71_CERRI|nr:hypothetical protein KP509_02G112700 [Ceratopteris richardii]